MTELLNNTGAGLTAEDLRSMTNWPDILIEDYLSLSSQLTQVTGDVIINIEQVSQGFANVADMRGRLNAAIRKLDQFTNENSTGQIRANLRAHNRELKQQAEMLSQTLTELSRQKAASARDKRAQNAKTLTRVVLGT